MSRSGVLLLLAAAVHAAIPSGTFMIQNAGIQTMRMRHCYGTLYGATEYTT
jgi:hypothetical protein